MKTNKEQIYDFLKLHASTKESGGVTTQYLADALGILRTNVSSLLNELVNEGRVSKSDGRPVLYKLKSQEEICEEQCFENLIGSEGSLRPTDPGGQGSHHLSRKKPEFCHCWRSWNREKFSRDDHAPVCNCS